MEDKENTISGSNNGEGKVEMEEDKVGGVLKWPISQYV